MARIALATALFALAAGGAAAQAGAGLVPDDLHSAWTLPANPIDKQLADMEAPESLPKPTASEAPAPILSCDPAGCWDNLGQRYSGGSAILTRSDGAVCQLIGTVIQC